MNLARRIGAAVVVAGGSAVASAALLPHGAWLAAAAVLILGWKVGRDAHLSRWRVRVTDEAVELVQRGRVPAAVRYDAICRIQRLWPSVRMFSHYLADRPDRERVIEGNPVRLVVPAGAEFAQVARRLWTASGDLLIQARSGCTLLVPLAALDGDTRRTLWTQLHLRAPRESFTRAPELIEQAFGEEKAANELVINRNRREALVRLRAAAEAWEKAGVMDCAARCLRHVVDCLTTLGHFTEAGGVTTRALRLAEELGDDRSIAYSLNHLAAIEYRVGGAEGLRRALEYLRRAAGLHEHLREPFLQSRTLSNAAIITEQAFTLRGEDEHLAASQRYAQQALHILRSMPRGSVGAHVQIQVANVLGTLARCEFHRRNWGRAAELFQEADQAGWSPTDRMIVDDLAMWGRVLVKMSRNGGAHPGEARPGMLHEALQKLGLAVLLAQAHGDLGELLQVYTLRGDTFWELGNWRAAVADYEVAIAFLADALAFHAPFDRAGLLRRYSRLYRAAAEGLMRMAQEDPAHAEARLELAFRYCEECRARNLAEMLQLSDEVEGQLPDPLRSRLSDARRRLQSAYVRMETVQQGGPGLQGSDLQDAWSQLHAAQQGLVAVQRDIGREVPRFETLASPTLPTLRAVRSWLPATAASAVLELAVGASSLCVFLITRDAPLTRTCFRIDGLGEQGIGQVLEQQGWLGAYEKYAGKRAERDGLERQYFIAWQQHDQASISCRADLRARIENLQDELDVLQGRWIDLLPDLIERLTGRILSAGGSGGESIGGLIRRLGIERLAIVPDGPLHRLPLHAAVEHVREVTYAPSSAILLDAVRRVVARPDRALVVANPEHLRNDVFDYSSDLFRKEADLVEALVCDGNVRRLDGSQAGHAAVLQGMSGCSLFHFAGHAASDLHSPLDSQLKVAREPPAGPADPEARWQSGFLRCRELMSQGELARGAWVVLDACETGVAPPDPSGEYVGLPGAFLVAGAGLVVSTLWEVDEASPVHVIDGFYRTVFGDRASPAAAMRMATMHLRQGAEAGPTVESTSRGRGVVKTRDTAAYRDAAAASPIPFSHPFHWAPFVVCGAPWVRAEVAEPQAQAADTPATRALPVRTAVGQHPKVNELAKRAKQLAETGEHQQAIGVLEQCLREFGSAPGLHDGLGNSYAEVGEVEKAIAHYTEALRFDPNSFVYHYNLGCVCRDFARPGEARQAFSAALRINPVYAKALFNLAGLTNDPGEALRLLREAGRIDPHDPDLAPAIRMWEELSRLSHAEVVRHRLLWASKDFEQRRYREARLHLALGREGAMDDADRAFSFMVDSDMLRQEGRIAESIVALETAVRLDPGKPHYWNNLGARRLLLCHDRGQPPSDRPGLLERAAQASRKAIALNDYARPHQNLAECYFLRRDLEAAKVEAGKALAMARKQLARAADGELVCAGCTTEGKMTGQCEQCVKKAQDSLRDIDLAAGDYRVT